jgi:diphthamide biosynthesis protein 2
MATEYTTFSTSGEDAITRTINVKVDTRADPLSQTAFDDFYEIERTAEEIVKGDYKRVRSIYFTALLDE